MKTFFTCILLFFSSFLFAQESPIDSLNTMDDINLDSAKNYFIGFGVGFNLMYPPEMKSRNSSENDSLNNWNGKVNSGYSIGIQYVRLLNDRFVFSSGLTISISNIAFEYQLKNNKINLGIPYSTIEVPFYYSYFPHFREGGFMGFGGIVPCIDITKKEDKDLRIFPLKTLNIWTTLGGGYTFVNSENTHFETKIALSCNLFNLINPEANIYTSTLNDIHLMRLSVGISIY